MHYVDGEPRTLAWPGGVDFAPKFLREMVGVRGSPRPPLGRCGYWMSAVQPPPPSSIHSSWISQFVPPDSVTSPTITNL
jgi:hypothetical protein